MWGEPTQATAEAKVAFKKQPLPARGPMVKKCVQCSHTKFNCKFSEDGRKGVFECRKCRSQYKLVYASGTVASCIAMLNTPGGQHLGYIPPRVIEQGGPFDFSKMLPVMDGLHDEHDT